MVDRQKHVWTHFPRLASIAALTACTVLALVMFVPSSATARSAHLTTRVSDHPAARSPAIAASQVTAAGDSATPAALPLPEDDGAAPVVSAVPAAPVTPVTPSATFASLIADVEASGIEPGANWSWSIGDTVTLCGPISGAGTGCTYGEAGLEHTIFSGTPTLALVAHELANAETQNDAIPGLLNQVEAVAGATLVVPAAAVASCLVEHFMGFQDNAAGIWQCPAALATVVAQNIHDA